jgi:hypothetical protein
LLKEAVAIEDGIPYNEPSVWHQPPRQVLGALLIEAGRAGEAEVAYREDLEAFPRKRVVAVRSVEQPERAGQIRRSERCARARESLAACRHHSRHRALVNSEPEV